MPLPHSSLPIAVKATAQLLRVFSSNIGIPLQSLKISYAKLHQGSKEFCNKGTQTYPSTQEVALMLSGPTAAE
ncbi:hypothetical protein ACOSQ2_004243 [Xanthoceras sorbifolium]